MAFKQGWHRENRPGIFGENHAMRKELVREYKEGKTGAPFGPHTAVEREKMNKAVERPPSSLLAPIELEAYFLYTGFLQGNKSACLGGGGQGAARISPSWQIVSELNGCMTINTPYAQSGDSLTFGAGPRWTPRAAEHRVSPYAQLLFGGQRIRSGLFPLLAAAGTWNQRLSGNAGPHRASVAARELVGRWQLAAGNCRSPTQVSIPRMSSQERRAATNEGSAADVCCEAFEACNDRRCRS